MNVKAKVQKSHIDDDKRGKSSDKYFYIKKIFTTAIALVFFPFCLWIFLLFLVRISDSAEVISIALHPLAWTGMFFSLIVTYLLTRKPFSVINGYLFSHNNKDTGKAQKAVSYSFYAVLTGTVLNMIITPGAVILNGDKGSHVSAVAFLFAFFSYSLASIPFSVRIKNLIDEWAGKVPLKDTIHLGIKGQMLIIIMLSVSCVGVLVILSVYALLTFHEADAANVTIRILILAPVAIAIIYFSFSQYCNSMVMQLQEATAFSISLQKGKLGGEMKNWRRDEVGILGNALSGIRENLQLIIEEIADTTAQLTDNLSEIASVTKKFSDHTQNQAASVEEISSTTEEVTHECDNINTMAVNQLDDVESLQEKINSLYELVYEIESVMKETLLLKSELNDTAKILRERVDLTRNNMGRAVETSDQALGSVQLITDISEKISLLSLNASIEAARAGEYGLGFAVIAEDVGRLSDNTTTNSKNIDELLRNSNIEIHNAMMSLKDSEIVFKRLVENISHIDENVISISRLSAEDMGLNKKVQEEAGKVSLHAADVQTASQDQKNAMSDVVNSLYVMSESVQVIAEGSSGIFKNIEKIQSIAAALREKINYFEI